MSSARRSRKPIAGDSAGPALRAGVSLALVLLGLAVGLSISELVLRFLDLRPQPLLSKRHLQPLEQDHARTRTSYDCYDSNPHAELRPAPEVNRGSWRLFDSSLPPNELPLERLAETPWCVEYAVWNGQLKLRDWQPGTPSADRRRRIVLIGDSFVRGVGVPADRTLSQQLEAALGHDEVEVINAGAPGADLAREVKILGTVLRRLRPDVILVVFIANDIRLSDSLSQQQDYINDLILIRDRHLEKHREIVWYPHHLRLIQLLGSYMETRSITRETIDWYLASYDPRHNPEGLEQLAADLARMARIGECPVGLVLYPILEGLEKDYPLAPVHETVTRMARKAGLPVLDLSPAFLGRDTADLWVHPTDHHPNGTAHRIAAGAIAQWLREGAPRPARFDPSATSAR